MPPRVFEAEIGPLRERLKALLAHRHAGSGELARRVRVLGMADRNIVLRLQPENVRRAMETFESLGYRPLVPVPLSSFADEETRKSWILEKNMVVFQLYSENHRETPIDLFVSEPFDFEVEYANATTGELLPGLTARFIRLEKLIEMKEAAGREKDLEDIRQLKLLLEHPESGQ